MSCFGICSVTLKCTVLQYFSSFFYILGWIPSTFGWSSVFEACCVCSFENVLCKVYNKVTVLITGKTSQCHSCDTSCKTCFGPQALGCASCFKGANIFLPWIIHPYCALYINLFICATGYFLDQEGSCVLQCPSGSFANSATQLCEECSPNCESCADNSDNCISCSKSSNKLFLHRGRCWSNCPE